MAWRAPNPQHSLARRRRDPAARLRRLPGAPGGTAETVARALARRLPPHRHGAGVPQRGGRRAGDPRLRAGPRRGLRHDQVLQRRPRLPRGQGAPSSAASSASSIDYVDLYLIHWPVPAHDRYVETWRAFVELREEGRVRAIGVSNFKPAHLERGDRGDRARRPRSTRSSCIPTCSSRELRAEHGQLGIVHRGLEPARAGRGARRARRSRSPSATGRRPRRS